MKKIILTVLSVVTISAGVRLLSAQAADPKPCKPIPPGCKLIKACSCDLNTGVCSDEIQCPLPT